MKRGVSVTVLSAEKLKPGDTPWFGAPGSADPYVVVSSGPGRELSSETSVRRQTLAPEWNEHLGCFPDADDSQLHFQVMDWDRVMKNTQLGEVSVDTSTLPEGESTHALQLTGGDGGGTLTVRFAVTLDHSRYFRSTRAVAKKWYNKPGVETTFKEVTLVFWDGVLYAFTAKRGKVKLFKEVKISEWLATVGGVQVMSDRKHPLAILLQESFQETLRNRRYLFIAFEEQHAEEHAALVTCLRLGDEHLARLAQQLRLAAAVE